MAGSFKEVLGRKGARKERGGIYGTGWCRRQGKQGGMGYRRLWRRNLCGVSGKCSEGGWECSELVGPTANPHHTQCPPTTERCTYTAKPTTPTRIVASNCPLFPHILCFDFIPNEQLHLAWPAANIPTPPTPRHQQPSATFTLRAPLLPSSHLKEPHPKRPAQATLFLPSNLLAPSHTSPRNSNPYAPSTTFIPATFTPPQTCAWEESIPHRHPIATWYISLKIDHGY